MSESKPVCTWGSSSTSPIAEVCRNCGHNMLVHGGHANPSLDCCVICKVEETDRLMRALLLHDADCPMTNRDPESRTVCVCDGPVAGGREPFRDTPVGGGS